MSGHDPDTVTIDPAVSEHYRRHATERAPGSLDAEVLRAAGASVAPNGFRRWATPAALAACVVVAISVALNFQMPPPIDGYSETSAPGAEKSLIEETAPADDPGVAVKIQDPDQPAAHGSPVSAGEAEKDAVDSAIKKSRVPRADTTDSPVTVTGAAPTAPAAAAGPAPASLTRSKSSQAGIAEQVSPQPQQGAGKSQDGDALRDAANRGDKTLQRATAPASTGVSTQEVVTGDTAIRADLGDKKRRDEAIESTRARATLARESFAVAAEDAATDSQFCREHTASAEDWLGCIEALQRTGEFKKADAERDAFHAIYPDHPGTLPATD